MTIKESATILVVDDQPTNLRILVNLLHDKGYEVLVAEGGSAAIEIAREEQPDIVLLDVMMPDMDGFAVCQQLKSESGTSDIPVIFLTALSEMTDKNKGFSVGGVDFITKPFHEQEVLLRIDSHLTIRRQQLQLEAEKELLAVTLRSIGDAVFTTDIQGRVTFMNRVAETLTGWTNAQAQGKPSPEVFNIINEKTGEKCASPVQRVLQLGRIIGLANHTALIAKNGVVRPIADSGAPIRDKESNTVGVVIVFRDVSREKKMEEELLKNRKLDSIGVLAGGIAHDFNNLLAMILGNLELASRRLTETDGRAAQILAEAGKATQRAVKLTQQLLTFSKGGEPIKEATALPALINDSANFVLQGSNAACHIDCPDNLWNVDIDSGQISQVVQNIIINADQAMPEGGRIEIACTNVDDPAQETLLSTHEGHYVRIKFTDSGIGIPKEVVEKIFDPYFTTKKRGSGLGLAICHSIISKHDGYLTVDSVPGQGTVFTIYLPALGEEAAVDTPATGITKATKSLQVLVLEDEKMLRDIISEQLADLGHTPTLTEDGGQTINKYQELLDQGVVVDVVIMDLTIPGGMGGQKAAEQLRKIAPTVKIIVASGYSTDPVLANYSAYGFDAALAKPFDLMELSKALAAVNP